jgi:hypothetical protein
MEPDLDHNHRLRNDGSDGYGESRDFRHLGRVPVHIYNDWWRDAMKQGIPLWDKREKDKWLKRKLSDYQKFQVAGKPQFRAGYEKRFVTDGGKLLKDAV